MIVKAVIGGVMRGNNDIVYYLDVREYLKKPDDLNATRLPLFVPADLWRAMPQSFRDN